MTRPVTPVTSILPGQLHHTDDYLMSPFQVKLLEIMISDILTIKPQEQLVIRNEMMDTLGLRNNEPLLARHFPDAHKFLTNRLCNHLEKMDKKQVIEILTRLISVKNGREIINNFIIKNFGVYQLGQLNPDILKVILMIFIDNMRTDNLESRLTRLNILTYMVKQTAFATGESCNQLWDKIALLTGDREPENLSIEIINTLLIWLSAKRQLSTGTDLRLESIKNALQDSLDPTEYLLLREYSQQHFLLPATLTLTPEQAQELLDMLILRRMSASTDPDMRNILPLYNQLALHFSQVSGILSVRPGLTLLVILIVLLLIVLFT
ncbi:hypothetical protein [Enterobacter ludwigii]|uniref:hypothetical protein n=1 Tax=Enterobacter ludwigii TaxID=299767 RepID=UPI003975AA10